MRISFITMQNSLVRQLDHQAEDIARLTNESSSGLKLTTPSDDPLAYSQAMNITQELSKYDTYSSNIDFATSWNETSDSAISDMIEQLQTALTTAISAVNDTSDSTTADANVATIESIIEQMVSLANTQYDGRYLFGGTADLTSTEAFSMDSSGIVTYNGDTGSIAVRTGSGSSNTVTVNINGEDLMNYTAADETTTNILTTLYDLKEAIDSGDTDAIQTYEADLNLALDHLSSAESTVGARLNRLDSQSSALENLTLSKKSTRTDLQDADYTEVLTQLTQKQTAYSATLEVISTLSSLNLTQYL